MQEVQANSKEVQYSEKAMSHADDEDDYKLK